MTRIAPNSLIAFVATIAGVTALLSPAVADDTDEKLENARAIVSGMFDQIKNIIATKRFATAKNKHRHKPLFLTKSPKLVDHTHRLFGRHIIRSSIITFNPPAMRTEKVALNSALPKQQTHNPILLSFQHKSLI
jgi:hypothetical protein